MPSSTTTLAQVAEGLTAKIATETPATNTSDSADPTLASHFSVSVQGSKLALTDPAGLRVNSFVNHVIVAGDVARTNQAYYQGGQANILFDRLQLNFSGSPHSGETWQVILNGSTYTATYGDIVSGTEEASTRSDMVNLLESKIDNHFNTAGSSSNEIVVQSSPAGTPIAASVQISAAASSTVESAISATATLGGTPANQHTVWSTVSPATTNGACTNCVKSLKLNSAHALNDISLNYARLQFTGTPKEGQVWRVTFDQGATDEIIAEQVAENGQDLASLLLLLRNKINGKAGAPTTTRIAATSLGFDRAVPFTLDFEIVAKTFGSATVHTSSTTSTQKVVIQGTPRENEDWELYVGNETLATTPTTGSSTKATIARALSDLLDAKPNVIARSADNNIWVTGEDYSSEIKLRVLNISESESTTSSTTTLLMIESVPQALDSWEFKLSGASVVSYTIPAEGLDGMTAPEKRQYISTKLALAINGTPSASSNYLAEANGTQLIVTKRTSGAIGTASLVVTPQMLLDSTNSAVTTTLAIQSDPQPQDRWAVYLGATELEAITLGATNHTKNVVAQKLAEKINEATSGAGANYLAEPNGSELSITRLNGTSVDTPTLRVTPHGSTSEWLSVGSRTVDLTAIPENETTWELVIKDSIDATILTRRYDIAENELQNEQQEELSSPAKKAYIAAKLAGLITSAVAPESIDFVAASSEAQISIASLIPGTFSVGLSVGEDDTVATVADLDVSKSWSGTFSGVPQEGDMWNVNDGTTSLVSELVTSLDVLGTLLDRINTDVMAHTHYLSKLSGDNTLRVAKLSTGGSSPLELDVKVTVLSNMPTVTNRAATLWTGKYNGEPQPGDTWAVTATGTAAASSPVPTPATVSGTLEVLRDQFIAKVNYSSRVTSDNQLLIVRSSSTSESQTPQLDVTTAITSKISDLAVRNAKIWRGTYNGGTTTGDRGIIRDGGDTIATFDINGQSRTVTIQELRNRIISETHFNARALSSNRLEVVKTSPHDSSLVLLDIHSDIQKALPGELLPAQTKYVDIKGTNLSGDQWSINSLVENTQTGSLEEIVRDWAVAFNDVGFVGTATNNAVAGFERISGSNPETYRLYITKTGSNFATPIVTIIPAEPVITPEVVSSVIQQDWVQTVDLYGEGNMLSTLPDKGDTWTLHVGNDSHVKQAGQDATIDQLESALAELAAAKPSYNAHIADGKIVIINIAGEALVIPGVSWSRDLKQKDGPEATTYYLELEFDPADRDQRDRYTEVRWSLNPYQNYAAGTEFSITLNEDEFNYSVSSTSNRRNGTILRALNGMRNLINDSSALYAAIREGNDLVITLRDRTTGQATEKQNPYDSIVADAESTKTASFVQMLADLDHTTVIPGHNIHHTVTYQRHSFGWFFLVEYYVPVYESHTIRYTDSLRLQLWHGDNLLSTTTDYDDTDNVWDLTSVNDSGSNYAADPMLAYRIDTETQAGSTYYLRVLAYRDYASNPFGFQDGYLVDYNGTQLVETASGAYLNGNQVIPGASLANVRHVVSAGMNYHLNLSLENQPVDDKVIKLDDQMITSFVGNENCPISPSDPDPIRIDRYLPDTDEFIVDFPDELPSGCLLNGTTIPAGTIFEIGDNNTGVLDSHQYPFREDSYTVHLTKWPAETDRIDLELSPQITTTYNSEASGTHQTQNDGKQVAVGSRLFKVDLAGYP
ncbi:MAG: hypothetical protein ABGX05_11470, partial [Pirellulaceae bacterium]